MINHWLFFFLFTTLLCIIFCEKKKLTSSLNFFRHHFHTSVTQAGLHKNTLKKILSSCPRYRKNFLLTEKNIEKGQVHMGGPLIWVKEDGR